MLCYLISSSFQKKQKPLDAALAFLRLLSSSCFTLLNLLYGYAHRFVALHHPCNFYKRVCRLLQDMPPQNRKCTIPVCVFFFFFFSQTSPSWSLHSGNFPRTRKLATSYTKCVLIHDLPTNVERWSCIPDVSRANQCVLAKSTRGLRDCCSFIKFHDFLDLFIEFLRGKCWKTRLISWSYSKAFLFLYQFCL